MSGVDVSGDSAGTDPNRRRWVDAAEHVACYRETDGQIGHTWQDRPHLLLTTTGRRSGDQHTVPLVYGQLPGSGSLVVVASAGGAEQHPAWYLNLVEDPAVDVQLWGERWPATATAATGDDEEAAWHTMLTTWTGFGTYREQTQRRIPIVLLRPHD